MRIFYVIFLREEKGTGKYKISTSNLQISSQIQFDVAPVNMESQSVFIIFLIETPSIHSRSSSIDVDMISTSQAYSPC